MQIAPNRVVFALQGGSVAFAGGIQQFKTHIQLFLPHYQHIAVLKPPQLAGSKLRFR